MLRATFHNDILFHRRIASMPNRQNRGDDSKQMKEKPNFIALFIISVKILMTIETMTTRMLAFSCQLVNIPSIGFCRNRLTFDAHNKIKSFEQWLHHVNFRNNVTYVREMCLTIKKIWEPKRSFHMQHNIRCWLLNQKQKLKLG